MFKLLALFVLIWIFIKAIGMIIKMVLGGTSSDQRSRSSNSSNHRHDGDINVDHNPNKSNKGYEGGEYIDYEDVE